MMQDTISTDRLSAIPFKINAFDYNLRWSDTKVKMSLYFIMFSLPAY